MNPKETILRALQGKSTERMPAALIGGGMWSFNHHGTTPEALSLDPEGMSGMLVKLAPVINSDIVYPGSGYPNMPAIAMGGKIRFRGVGAVDLEGPVVSSEDELDRLEPERLDQNRIINTIREAFRLTRSKIGEEYMVSLTGWGPFTLGARIIGEEALIKGLLKNPRYVHKALGLGLRLLKQFFKPLVEARAIELVTIGDPTASGDLISKKQFKEYALPYLKEFFEWAKEHGVDTMLHICGNTTDRLDLYPETGATCISLDHKTDIRKASEVLKGKCCLAGNLDPVNVLMQGSPEDVRNTANTIMDLAGSGSGFILMPGCDIPPAVPLENLQSFFGAAHARKPGAA